MSEIQEGLFICGSIVTVMLLGVLALHFLGIMVVKIWDRRRKRSRWAVVRRVI